MSRLLEDIAERFDLPAEALAGLPRITLSGDRRALVENHRGLLAYEPDAIEVSGGSLRLKIAGEGLCLRAMDASTLVITGRIFAVELG